MGPLMSQAQEEGISQRKQEKILAKKEREEKKQKIKQDKENREHHLNLQDKATRKRMKKHGKRADRHGSGAHRDGFLSRMFRRKR
jgi:hypothetical protein